MRVTMTGTMGTSYRLVSPNLVAIVSLCFCAEDRP